MHPHDRQPTAVFTSPVAAPPTRPARRGWLIAAVIAAVVAGASALVVAFTVLGDDHPTTATGIASGTAGQGGAHDKEARQAWARQYGIDRKTGTNLPDIASATDEQRQAAADLLSRTEAATAGWSDITAAKAAGFDIAAQLAESEKHNDKIAGRLAEIDAHGPGRHLLTMTVLNKGNVENAQVLDPSAPQALLYAYQGKGAWKVIGARFLADKLYPAAPPTPGGPITRWAYDRGNHLTMRMYFVPGNALQQAYALRLPQM
jgi:hypothetical protein